MEDEEEDSKSVCDKEKEGPAEELGEVRILRGALDPNLHSKLTILKT